MQRCLPLQRLNLGATAAPTFAAHRLLPLFPSLNKQTTQSNFQISLSNFQILFYPSIQSFHALAEWHRDFRGDFRCSKGRAVLLKLQRKPGGMQRLAMATHRRIVIDTKTGRPCFACSFSSSNASGGENFDRNSGQSPPQEAVLKAISEVSKADGRVAQTSNMVLGGTVSESSESEWNEIDQKVNVYPMVRDFTAIGIGGDEFVKAMVEAVESIVESPVPEGGVSKKLSARGKYVSVKIGGVTVSSSEQVRAVYDAMKKDVRMKYFL